jgi:hypothetical protein
MCLEIGVLPFHWASGYKLPQKRPWSPFILAACRKVRNYSDGSRTAVSDIEQGLVEVTGWNLPNTTFLVPSGATGQFPLTLVVTIENEDRPLFTQAAFIVNIGQDRADTVQAFQEASRLMSFMSAGQEGSAKQARSGPGESAGKARAGRVESKFQRSASDRAHAGPTSQCGQLNTTAIQAEPTDPGTAASLRALR